MNKKAIGISFILLSMLALCTGALFGCIGSLQYIIPGFLNELPFFKSRPMHVSLVVAWIFLCAVGGIYYYLPRFCNLPLFSVKISRLHFWIFLITGLVIIGSYIAGKFGGREYWEFPPILAIPILFSWLLFGYNFFKTVAAKTGSWPVYLWMWGTGIFFFFLTFSESYLWIFPYFNKSIIRDLAVQWKAYGSLVGSWNMLVYGTAIFIMERIKGDDSIAKSKLAFLMYFLGFTNLLFGWAHHIYIVPTASWIRYFAYFISMTELIILAKIIYDFQKSLTHAKAVFYQLTAKFIVASDFWIFINLTLALLISVPAINVFTHGTHITVAHSMGSTIGINTMILLSSCVFIIQDYTNCTFNNRQKNTITTGFWIMNLSLFLFFLSLIFAGVEKAKLIMGDQVSFREIMNSINPYLISFSIAGIGLFTGICIVVFPLIKILVVNKSTNDSLNIKNL
ncbi:MAG: cbb3-type cytochrome c oxidase subunit I [Bacteroidia bacterium]